MGGHSYGGHHHHYGGSRISYSSGGGCTINPKVFFMGLFILFIILYVVIAAAVYPKTSNKATTLSLSETRAMGVSSTWYEKVAVETPTFKRDADNDEVGVQVDDLKFYRFSEKPPLSITESWNTNHTLLSIADYDHYYWSWYFYKGSSIKITWNYNAAITMYFVRSIKGYNAYYDESTSLTKYEIDTVKNPSGSKTYTIAKDDIYFVIFENWRAIGAQGNSTFSITSKLYNVSSFTDSCTPPCEFNVEYGTDDVYVLYTPTVTEYEAAGKGGPNSE